MQTSVDYGSNGRNLNTALNFTDRSGVSARLQQNVCKKWRGGPCASYDRYENCKYDGYRKELVRPVIRWHDNLQKVYDYDRGSESLALTNARRREKSHFYRSTMAVVYQPRFTGTWPPVTRTGQDLIGLTRNIAPPPMPPEINERIVY